MQHWPSPVDRLPAEVVSKCLLLTLGDRVPAFDSTEAPLLFLTVCHRWRDIALSTPRLWSRVLVLAEQIAPDDLEAALSAFDAWLSRSGTLPLSCYVKDYREKNSSHDKFYSIIIRYAHRLHELHFNCRTTPVFSSPIPLFPILRSTSLLFWDLNFHDREAQSAFSRTLKNTPNLDSLATDVIRFRDYPDTYHERVTKLRVVLNSNYEARLNAMNSVHALMDFSNLEVLAIDAPGGRLSNDNPGWFGMPIQFTSSS